MKIWQRIFLITLLIAMSVMMVEFVIINEEFESQLSEAVKQSVSLHNSMYESIERRVENWSLFEEYKDIATSEYEEMVDSTVKEHQYTEYGIQMRLKMHKEEDEEYRAEENFTVTNYHFYAINTDDMEIESTDQVKYKIRYWRNIYQLNVKSMFDKGDMSITTVSQLDVSYIYNLYESQINTLKKTGLVLLIEAALILLIVITSLMIPLKKVQIGIREITEGNYGKQIKFKGNTEISELTRDINQMSEKIAQNIGEMEEMAENRRIFIGNMAHEMKTPLTAILGFADILTIKPGITDEQKIEYSEHIYNEALRLRAMSAKLMELMQLQGDSLKPEIVNLKELLQDVADTEGVIFEKDNIKIHTKLCDAKVNADTDLLKSLFFNVLDNANKATENGGKIDIVMKKNKISVEIRIIDYGIGIPEDDIKKVVEPFYMVDKSRTRKSGGAGLGLALCKKIVDLNNGTMEFQSQEGKGCTVIITLPIIAE